MHFTAFCGVLKWLSSSFSAAAVVAAPAGAGVEGQAQAKLGARIGSKAKAVQLLHIFFCSAANCTRNVKFAVGP
jgi:hypothetical protein